MGAQGCIVCPAGQYDHDSADSLSAATPCVPCELARYQSLSNMTECIVCEAGQYQSAVGASSCIACQPGTYVETRGNDEAS
eukprot:COSAG01_NODE_41336_length_452_cov_102.198300_1_plen_80_part_10